MSFYNVHLFNKIEKCEKLYTHTIRNKIYENHTYCGKKGKKARDNKKIVR